MQNKCIYIKKYIPTPHEENLTAFKIKTTHTTHDTTDNNLVIRKTRLIR